MSIEVQCTKPCPDCDGKDRHRRIVPGQATCDVYFPIACATCQDHGRVPLILTLSALLKAIANGE